MPGGGKKSLDRKGCERHAEDMNATSINLTHAMRRLVPAWKRMRLSASEGLMKH
jgi:hypothetical protein